MSFGGSPSTPPPMLPDTSALQAQQQQAANAASDAAKTKLRNAGGAYALLNSVTQYQGVGTSGTQTLGNQ